jgi:hypothetical protein
MNPRKIPKVVKGIQKNFRTQQHKIHSIWHLIKYYQACRKICLSVWKFNQWSDNIFTRKLF